MDLLNAFRVLSQEFSNIFLDIYGPLELLPDDEAFFNSLLSDKIQYKGVVEPNCVVKTIKKYDCFVFPTLCPNEGMPGAIGESFIAGVPIVSSEFPQSKELLSYGNNSLLYDFGNLNSLENALRKVIVDVDFYHKITDGARETGKKYSYSFWRNQFLSFINVEEK